MRKTYEDGLIEAATIAENAAAENMAISQGLLETDNPSDLESAMLARRRANATQKVADQIRAALAASPTASDTDTAIPVGCRLTERQLDDDCGCPEEFWDTPWGFLHMHLSAGKPSNACLDDGDQGERSIELTTATVDEARAAIFGWAKAYDVLPASPKPDTDTPVDPGVEGVRTSA